MYNYSNQNIKYNLKLIVGGLIFSQTLRGQVRLSTISTNEVKTDNDTYSVLLHVVKLTNKLI